MKSLTALCILAVVCSAFGAPESGDFALLAPIPRDLDLLGNTRKLIEDLVANLRKSAEEALHAVGQFNAGIRDQALLFRNKIFDDVLKFRQRVTDAINNVFERVSNSSLAVRECVESHRNAAATVFNDTLSNTLSCVDDHIAEISEHINELTALASEAYTGAEKAVEDMRKCTENNTNLLATGSCLGSVAVQTELKAVGFLSHSGILIGRINVGIATLPASLEVCAGTRLVQTGVSTGRIIVEIGTCSATGFFNTILGRPQPQTNEV